MHFLYEADDYAYVNTWHKDATDQHATLTLASKAFEDGPSVATLAVTPSTGGTCDTTFTQLFVLPQSCPALRDTTFKAWKFYVDLGGVASYEDPTSPAVVALFLPVATGCLVVKTGLLFMPAGE